MNIEWGLDGTPIWKKKKERKKKFIFDISFNSARETSQKKKKKKNVLIILECSKNFQKIEWCSSLFGLDFGMLLELKRFPQS